jgi:hypothetical protein
MRRKRPERNRPARARLSRPVEGASRGEWVFGRRPSPFLIEQPVPYRPHLLILLEAETGRLVAMEAVEPASGTPAVAEWVASKVRGATPLRVEDDGLAQALRERLGDTVAVRVAQAPELDEVVDSLETQVDRDRDPAGPSWTDGAATDALTGFYEAAAQFDRSAPWDKVSDSHVLSVAVPALGRAGGIVSVIGQLGESFGLLLLRSLDDYVAFLRLSDADAQGRRRAPGAGVSLFTINFERPRDLPGGKKLAARARSHGFRPGPKGRVPYLLNVSPDGVPTPLTTDDYRLGAVVLEAVRRFIERHGHLFTDPPDQHVEETSRIAMPDGEVEVVVTAPPVDLPWRWGEEEAIDGVHRRDREEILAAFDADRRGSGASEADADAARWAAEEFLEFKAGWGGALTEWTPDDVAEYLLGYYPLEGLEVGADLQAIPGRLDAFLGWLASSGRGPAVAMGAARERLAECREGFLRDASDPRKFGPAKTLVQAMRAAGVDHTDRAAVDAFVRDFNRRLQKDPSLLPGGRDRRQAKAWVWSGEGPPPDPSAPCPCGSGKRYRRCCRPR